MNKYDDYFSLVHGPYPSKTGLKYWNRKEKIGMMIPLNKDRAERMKRLLEQYLKRVKE